MAASQRVAPLGSLALLAAMALVADGASWRRVDEASAYRPAARSRAGLGFDPASMQLVLFGGGDGSSDTWLYNVSANAWRQAPLLARRPPGRFSFVYGSAPGKFLIATGEGPGRVFYSDVWEFDVRTESWTELSANGAAAAPRERYGAWGGVVAASGTLIVSHGFNRHEGRFDDTFTFDVAARTWTDVSASASRPHARCLGAGTVLSDGALLAFGGCGSGGYGPCPSDESWRFEAAAPGRPGLWTRMDRYCPAAALEATMAAVPSTTAGDATRAVVLGGRGRSDVTIGLVDAATGRWATLDVAPCPPGACPAPLLSGAASASAVPARVVYVYTAGELWALGGPFEASDPSPDDTCRPRFDYRTTHATLMMVAWGFLLPLGVTIARFRDVFGPSWFLWHRGVQGCGIAIQLVGLIIALIINQIGKFLAVPHAIPGLIIAVGALQQPINAYFRPHITSGEPKTNARTRWEYLHKGAGYLMVIIGLIQPFTGLRYLNGSLNTTLPESNHASYLSLIVYSLWFAAIVTFWIAMIGAKHLKSR